jgi:hypothetical protein
MTQTVTKSRRVYVLRTWLFLLVYYDYRSTIFLFFLSRGF